MSIISDSRRNWVSVKEFRAMQAIIRFGERPSFLPLFKWPFRDGQPLLSAVLVGR